MAASPFGTGTKRLRSHSHLILGGLVQPSRSRVFSRSPPRRLFGPDCRLARGGRHGSLFLRTGDAAASTRLRLRRHNVGIERAPLRLSRTSRHLSDVLGRVAVCGSGARRPRYPPISLGPLARGHHCLLDPRGKPSDRDLDPASSPGFYRCRAFVSHDRATRRRSHPAPDHRLGDRCVAVERCPLRSPSLGFSLPTHPSGRRPPTPTRTLCLRSWGRSSRASGGSRSRGLSQSQPPGFYPEQWVWVGALASSSPSSRRSPMAPTRGGGLAVATVITAAASVVQPVDTALNTVPLIGHSWWSRSLIPLAFCLAMLAGEGLDAVLRGSERRQALRWAIGLAARLQCSWESSGSSGGETYRPTMLGYEPRASYGRPSRSRSASWLSGHWRSSIEGPPQRSRTRRRLRPRGGLLGLPERCWCSRPCSWSSWMRRSHRRRRPRTNRRRQSPLCNGPWALRLSDSVKGRRDLAGSDWDLLPTPTFPSGSISSRRTTQSNRRPGSGAGRPRTTHPQDWRRSTTSFPASTARRSPDGTVSPTYSSPLGRPLHPGQSSTERWGRRISTAYQAPPPQRWCRRVTRWVGHRSTQEVRRFPSSGPALRPSDSSQRRRTLRSFVCGSPRSRDGTRRSTVDLWPCPPISR